MAKSQYLAAYDITDDDLRKAVADLLKNNGLERIQYSVFYGELTRNEAEEIGIKFKEITLKHTAQLILLPLCEMCAKKQLIINNEGNCPHNEKKKEKMEKITPTEPEKEKKHKKETDKKDRNEGKKNKEQVKKEEINKNNKRRKNPISTPLDELKEKKQQKIIFYY